MSTTETSQVWEARRDAGIAFIERHAPADWPQRVRLSTLDMCDGAYCVAGQVFGGYGEAEELARQEAGMTDDEWTLTSDGDGYAWTRWGVACGFLPDDEMSYDDLERAWTRELRDRDAAA